MQRACVADKRETTMTAHELLCQVCNTHDTTTTVVTRLEAGVAVEDVSICALCLPTRCLAGWDKTCVGQCCAKE